MAIWTFLHINIIFEATILDQPDCYSNHYQNFWLPWQNWHTPFCKVIWIRLAIMNFLFSTYVGFEMRGLNTVKMFNMPDFSHFKGQRDPRITFGLFDFGWSIYALKVKLGSWKCMILEILGGWVMPHLAPSLVQALLLLNTFSCINFRAIGRYKTLGVLL